MDRRLHRSSSDKLIAGVCGGIGETYNIDPTIIRLIWAGLSLLAGAGIVLYIIAIFVMPVEA